MPFVYRNFKGEITGYAAVEQDKAKEFVPDDDPELLAFKAKHPVTDVPPLTPKELARLATESQKLGAERVAMTSATARFHELFSGLEVALSALLYATINRPDTRVAYAIYYSPTGFDARVGIVENAVLETVLEVPTLRRLLELWPTIRKGINRSRNLRNAIAHGSQLVHHINGKMHLRLSPPAFDVIRIGRVIANRQIPGLTANDLKVGAQKLIWAIDRVDEVNRLLTAHYAGDPALPERFLELEAGLKKSDSP